jgi:exopolyphosphatase/guanosine-5'-triphosphate,3'-diphosphate pyrophosphatase
VILKLYLVRHARAEPRGEWSGHDELRPLSQRGREESVLLADSLADDPPVRLISSPALRCQQTLEPLAVEYAIPIEVDERLAEGESAARALELLPTLDEGPVAFCTHGDVIEALLTVLELRAPGADDDASCCRKGAYWRLEGSGYTPSRAHYVEPSGRPKRRDRASAARPETVRAAALDLGSTSFNLLIADVRRDGRITPVIREKMMLRLGTVIAHGGHIPKEVSKLAVETARELAELAEREKVQHLIAVGTAALREASNGAKLADAIGKALGAPIRILSGREEARTIFRAFERRLNFGSAPVLGLDLGGGSLELAIGRGGTIDYEASLGLGAVRLHAELVAHDPMRREEAAALRARVRSELAPHREAFLAGGAVRAVAAGGTVRALARVADERRARRLPHPSPAPHLPLAELQALERELVASAREERLALRGMRKRRADLVATGAVVLTTLAEALDLDAYTVCDWSLREGLLLEALEQGLF